jgi:hypothetical protein
MNLSVMTTTRKPDRRVTSNFGGFGAIRSAAAGLDSIDIGLNDDYRLADLPFQPRTSWTSEQTVDYFSRLAAPSFQDAAMDIFQDAKGVPLVRSKSGRSGSVSGSIDLL